MGTKGHELTPESHAKILDALRGLKRSPFSAEHRYKLSQARKGRFKGVNAGHWKGGRTINSFGYFLVHCPDHPCADARGYVREHRLVMEAHIGRVLLPTEIVHHINGNIKDNRIENLMLFSSIGKHLKYHAAGRKERKN